MCRPRGSAQAELRRDRASGADAWRSSASSSRRTIRSACSAPGLSCIRTTRRSPGRARRRAGRAPPMTRNRYRRRAGPARRATKTSPGLRRSSRAIRMRRIAWKAYARGQGLHTKQYAGTDVDLARLRLGQPAPVSTPKHDWRSCAAGSSMRTSAAKRSACACRARRSNRTSAPAHRQRCLNALALFDDAGARPCLRRARTRCTGSAGCSPRWPWPSYRTCSYMPAWVTLLLLADRRMALGGGPAQLAACRREALRLGIDVPRGTRACSARTGRSTASKPARRSWC